MKKILVGIDFTDADQIVLEAVKPLAKQTGASLTLIHVVPPMSQWVGCYLAYVPEDLEKRRQADAEFRAKLKTVEDELASEGFEVDSIVTEGHPGPGIVKHAQETGCDQIVIGTHSKNMIERALLGSAADHVVRKSTVPVLVIPTMS